MASALMALPKWFQTQSMGDAESLSSQPHRATRATRKLPLGPKGDNGDVPGDWPQLRVRKTIPAEGRGCSRDR